MRVGLILIARRTFWNGGLGLFWKLKKTSVSAVCRSIVCEAGEEATASSEGNEQVPVRVRWHGVSVDGVARGDEAVPPTLVGAVSPCPVMETRSHVSACATQLSRHIRFQLVAAVWEWFVGSAQPTS